MDDDWDHSYNILSGMIKANEMFPLCWDRFNEIVCDFMTEHGIPGVAVSISLHGKPIYRQGYGLARDGEPATSSSHFRIASISKVLTALGVMKLCEDGHLALTDKVFGETGVLSHLVYPAGQVNVQVGDITVLHLLQHSAGWNRDKDGDHVFWYQAQGHSQHLDVWDTDSCISYILQHAMLYFKPGCEHSYSNFGYQCLGVVIERVTGMPYEDCILSVLREVGIHDIAVGQEKQQLVNINEVKYYNNSSNNNNNCESINSDSNNRNNSDSNKSDSKDSLLAKSIFLNEGHVVPQYGSFPMSTTGSYGGWVACPADLVSLLDGLVMAYDTPHPLSPHSVSQMLKKPKYAKGDFWYGLGLDVLDKGASFGHTGAMEGMSTTLHHDKSGVTWCLLTNAWAKDMDLDGLIKYALSSVVGLPFWQGNDINMGTSQYLLRAGDEKQAVRILLPHSQFYRHVREMKNKGYTISHIDVLSDNDDVLFNIVWTINCGNDWCLCIDIELNCVMNHILMMRKKGLSLAILELYHCKGRMWHLLVFDRSSDVEQKIYITDDLEQHKLSVRTNNSEGFLLKYQAVKWLNGKRIVSAIYNKVKSRGTKQEIWLNLPTEDFEEVFGTFIKNRYTLECLQCYSMTGPAFISAVWTKSRVWKKHLKDMYLRHEVTKYGFLNEMRECMQTNLPVRCVSAYRREGVTYFTTLWDQYSRKGKKTETTCPTESMLDPDNLEVNDSMRDLINPNNLEVTDVMGELIVYLFDLRDQSSSILTRLSEEQSEAIVALWETSASATRVSGNHQLLESDSSCTTGCLLCLTSRPTQVSNPVHLTEALLWKLYKFYSCMADPSAPACWTLVKRDYCAIRTLIYGDPQVISRTTINLKHLQDATLSQWCFTLSTLEI